MFNLAEETEPDWDQEIAEDVEAECSKYGRVRHIHVEKQEPGGFVYLMFEDVPSAQKAAEALNGRFFAGRMLSVEFLPPAEYTARFPSAV